MKNINLMSLVQASDSLAPLSFSSYLNLHGIKMKPAEITDLKNLLKALYALPSSISIFDSFYVGYKIPQIGKEFDLLRFGKSFIINIELKSTCSEERVRDQLIRNKYYLTSTGRKIYAFSYVSDVTTLYYLQDSDTLVRINLVDLRNLINQQEIDRTENIDNLFEPSDYLVSPFNSTRKFMNSEYFLTHQQEEVKKQILQSLATPMFAKFFSIVGSAGTGKTLLIYDIAKQLIKNNRKPLLVHCGYLNAGQHELIKNGWAISPIKHYRQLNLENYDLVIIDEAQRLFEWQLNDIIAKNISTSSNCIFSYDKNQTLSYAEVMADLDGKINSIAGIVPHKLSEKIRTNKEIANFIKVLFNNSRKIALSSKNNIEVNYFKSLEDARFYLSALGCAGWEVIKFTPSQYNKEHHAEYFAQPNKTSHEVIGQEFDNVAITIDRFFSYDPKGELCYKGNAYYHASKMLFQNITRARKRLNIVIIDNEEVLNRCVEVLQ
jgi:hypothetical protein